LRKERPGPRAGRREGKVRAPHADTTLRGIRMDPLDVQRMTIHARAMPARFVQACLLCWTSFLGDGAAGRPVEGASGLAAACRPIARPCSALARVSFRASASTPKTWAFVGSPSRSMVIRVWSGAGQFLRRPTADLGVDSRRIHAARKSGREKPLVRREQTSRHDVVSRAASRESGVSRGQGSSDHRQTRGPAIEIFAQEPGPNDR